MTDRVLICFPTGNTPGLRTGAAQLALGLASRGREVVALGPLGPWRHMLRLSGVVAENVPLPDEERRLIRAIQEYEPQIIHAFGAETAHMVLPLTLLVGAGGVASLSHEDLMLLNPVQFRTASAVFVPCDYLREQVARRLPSVSVVTTGYLLRAPVDIPESRKRFLAEELGLQDGAPVILLADHYRNSETEVAMRLIEATPRLVERVPGLQVVVAGEGVRLGELEQAAIEVNYQLGARTVLLPGHRDDIDQLLSLATVAVGSGRFAMEAAGSGVPLVAAGSAGIIGTYTDKSASVSQFTCCGRHGHLEPVTTKNIASEIIGLFAYPQYRERFALEGQAYALSRWERSERSGQIAAYYRRSAPTGTIGRTPQRILAVMPDDLRELLFALPAIAGLRAQFPLGKIHLVCPSRHRRFLRRLAMADTVLSLPVNMRDWPGFLRELCCPRADVCLAFGDALQTAFISGLSLASHRLGFDSNNGSILFTDHVPSQGSASPTRAVTLVHALGISAGAPVPPPPAGGLPEDIETTLAGNGVSQTDEIILLAPDAGNEYDWEAHQWETLAQFLMASGREERLVMLDGQAYTLPPEVIPLAMPEDTLDLAALLARSGVVVSSDGPALHLADLLGRRTIGLYGPTSPNDCSLPNEHASPICHTEFPCHPCANATCQERHCLRALTPAEVSSVISDLLPVSQPS